MSKIDEYKVKKLIHSLGLKYNLSDDIITKLVNSPYLFTYSKLKELDLENIKTEDKFNELKTNFLYKSFMRLYIDYKLLNRRNKHKENINKINKEKWKN